MLQNLSHGQCLINNGEARGNTRVVGVGGALPSAWKTKIVALTMEVTHIP